jgi:hypothetical protein
MVCTDCDIPMNRHAEKPLRFLPSGEYRDPDSIFDGMLASIHSCPGCGKSEIDTASGINLH